MTFSKDKVKDNTEAYFAHDLNRSMRQVKDISPLETPMPQLGSGTDEEDPALMHLPPHSCIFYFEFRILCPADFSCPVCILVGLLLPRFARPI